MSNESQYDKKYALKGIFEETSIFGLPPKLSDQNIKTQPGYPKPEPLPFPTKNLTRSNTLRNLTMKFKKPLENTISSLTGKDSILSRSVSMLKTQSIRLKGFERTKKPIPIFAGSKAENTKLWQETLEDPALMNNLSRMEIKRQEVIYELIQTEKEYVSDLRHVIDDYMNPIQIIHLLTAEEHARMFANIKSLYEINSGLLAALERKQQEEEIVFEIGSVLEEHFRKFTEYSTYFQNLVIAKLEYNNKMNGENTAFQRFIKTLDSSNQSRRLDFWSFLDYPRRRISKYPLLIKTILECTPSDHPDYKALKAAFAVIDEIVTLLHESQAISDQAEGDLSSDFNKINIRRNPSMTSVCSNATVITNACNSQKQREAQKLLSLQQTFRDTPLKEVQKTLLRAKEMFHEGILVEVKSSKVVAAILIDSGLILLKREKNAKSGDVSLSCFKRLFSNPIPLSMLQIVDVEKLKGKSMPGSELSFLICDYSAKKPQELHFQAPTAMQKAEWMNAFAKAIPR